MRLLKTASRHQVNPPRALEAGAGDVGCLDSGVLGLVLVGGPRSSSGRMSVTLPEVIPQDSEPMLQTRFDRKSSSEKHFIKPCLSESNCISTQTKRALNASMQRYCRRKSSFKLDL